MTRRTANVCIAGADGAGVRTTTGCLLYKLGGVNLPLMEKLEKEGLEKYQALPAWFDRNDVPKVFATPALDIQLVDAKSTTRVDMIVLVVSNDTRSTMLATTNELLVHFPGCERLLVLVNKMDSNGWNQMLFTHIVETLKEHVALKSEISQESMTFIPFCALTGENLLAISPHTPWHRLEGGHDTNDIVKGTVVEAMNAL